MTCGKETDERLVAVGNTGTYLKPSDWRLRPAKVVMGTSFPRGWFDSVMVLGSAVGEVSRIL